MKCFICKGHLIDSLTTFMTETDGNIIIIKNVPSDVCGQCGEVSYNNKIAEKLEKIVNLLRASAAEISVTSFTDNVA